MQQKTLITVVIGVIIIFAGAWFYFSGDKTENVPVESSDVMARVNGEEITKDDFEASKSQLIASQNIDISSLDEKTISQIDKQVLDTLINNSLVQQAVKKNKIKVSKEEVDAQMKAIKGQFENEEAFQGTLVEQGISEEELYSQVTSDLTVQKYLEETLDLKSIIVTEEEIQSVYDQEASTNKDLPALSEVGNQIKAFIIQQKQQELLSVHIQKLRDDADIETLN